MTTNEGGEDHEIDTEALQARIDLVMARVHEMATSWLSPSLKSSGRVRDTEKIIEEQLRRPPRLGVGAPIPSNAFAHQEMARLEDRLKGKKKRTRDEEDDVKMQSSDNEEESRASAIKKRPKVDMFGGKNAGKQGDDVPKRLSPLVRSEAKQVPGREGVVVETRVNRAPDSPASPMSPVKLSKSQAKKLRRRLKKLAESKNGSPSKPIIAPLRPNDPTSSSTQSNNSDDSTQKLSSTSPKPFGKFLTPPMFISPSEVLPALTQKLPLLNLDGPPESSDDDQIGISDQKSKKKRRKRRKHSKAKASMESSLGN